MKTKLNTENNSYSLEELSRAELNVISRVFRSMADGFIPVEDRVYRLRGVHNAYFSASEKDAFDSVVRFFMEEIERENKEHMAYMASLMYEDK